ncbi:MAG: DUF5989 family protein [Acidobacteriota bacterium]|nr:DUF5989 family protein [Acidobacteriota bacterium]
MSVFTGLGSRAGTVGELFSFLWQRKLWWMIPIAMVLTLTGVLLAFAQGSAAGRFLYPVF